MREIVFMAFVHCITNTFHHGFNQVLSLSASCSKSRISTPCSVNWRNHSLTKPARPFGEWRRSAVTFIEGHIGELVSRSWSTSRYRYIPSLVWSCHALVRRSDGRQEPRPSIRWLSPIQHRFLMAYRSLPGVHLVVRVECCFNTSWIQ